MKRHMPGPPECECATSKTGLTVYTLRCQRHSPFSAAHLALHPPKRLTDAECAAEYWRAMFDAEYETPHGYERQIVIVRTLHRFATHPHALEES